MLDSSIRMPLTISQRALMSGSGSICILGAGYPAIWIADCHFGTTRRNAVTMIAPIGLIVRLLSMLIKAGNEGADGVAIDRVVKRNLRVMLIQRDACACVRGLREDTAVG